MCATNLRVSFADPQSSMNASLQILVKLQKPLSERLIGRLRISPWTILQSHGPQTFSKIICLANRFYSHSSDLKYPSSTWFRQHLHSAGIIISHFGKTWDVALAGTSTSCQFFVLGACTKNSFSDSLMWTDTDGGFERKALDLRRFGVW